MSRRQSMIAKSETLRQCAEYWSDNRRFGPGEDGVDAYLGPLAGISDSLFAVAVNVGPLGFHFQHWGDCLKRQIGHDLTGLSVVDPALGEFGRLQKAEYTDAMIDGASIASRGCFYQKGGALRLNYLRAVFPVYGPEMTCRMIFGAIDFQAEGTPPASNWQVDLDAVLLHDVAQNELLDVEFI